MKGGILRLRIFKPCLTQCIEQDLKLQTQACLACTDALGAHFSRAKNQLAAEQIPDGLVAEHASPITSHTACSAGSFLFLTDAFRSVLNSLQSI
jgi:hypothetical protein